MFDPNTSALRLTISPALSPSEFQSNLEFTLEWSHAIKCPTIPLQLASGKKFQEVLSFPGIMEQFMSDADA
ncbi:hypothetical protein EDC04DRAFT_2899871 [Pisolithus marmoratus]|nr:hypothetical protein EDC04DRAFT_2899871 [Pisolithus marmoratus]